MPHPTREEKALQRREQKPLGELLEMRVALSVQRRLGATPGYGLTLIWALVGIIVANGITPVGAFAALGIVAMSALLAFQLRQSANQPA